MITHYEQKEFILGIECWFNIGKSVNVKHAINRKNGKKHIIISMDAEKSLCYHSNLYTTKDSRQTRNERKLPQSDKTYKKHFT